MYTYICIYNIHTYVDIHIYIYMYIERERIYIEREMYTHTRIYRQRLPVLVVVHPVRDEEHRLRGSGQRADQGLNK